mmetsp:Transcript_40445/g.94652  ORF Transcript_40445/g.94652 Transcript_40445/m.94652 type:complete len:222 (-) Transcript_40445:1063-1728(-)
MPACFLEGSAPNAIDRVDLDTLEAEELINDADIAIGCSQVQCCSRVVVSCRRVHPIDKQNFKCLPIIIRSSLAHPDAHITDRQICACLPEGSLHLFVPVPHSIIERIPPEPILCGHVGLVLEQQLHHRKVSFARCKVKGSPVVIVSLHRLHAVLHQPLNSFSITDAGSLAQLDTRLSARQLNPVHQILDVDFGLLHDPSVHLCLLESLSRRRRCVGIPHTD